MFDFVSDLSSLFSEVTEPIRRILMHDYSEELLLWVMQNDASSVFVFLRHVFDECKR